LFLDCGCKGTTFFFTSKHFPDFSSKKSYYNIIYHIYTHKDKKIF